jgi:hypothetical protein
LPIRLLARLVDTNGEGGKLPPSEQPFSQPGDTTKGNTMNKSSRIRLVATTAAVTGLIFTMGAPLKLLRIMPDLIF